MRSVRGRGRARAGARSRNSNVDTVGGILSVPVARRGPRIARGPLGGELADRHLRLVRLYIEGGFLVTALALLPALLGYRP